MNQTGADALDRFEVAKGDDQVEGVIVKQEVIEDEDIDVVDHVAPYAAYSGDVGGAAGNSVDGRRETYDDEDDRGQSNFTEYNQADAAATEDSFEQDPTSLGGADNEIERSEASDEARAMSLVSDDVGNHDNIIEIKESEDEEAKVAASNQKKRPHDDEGDPQADAVDEDTRPDPDGPNKQQKTSAGTTAPTSRWMGIYMRLVEYRDQFGDCLVPNRFSADAPLGHWVSSQRRQYKALMAGQKGTGSMNEDRIQKLNAIGFEWETGDPRHMPWDIRYNELAEYVERFGDAQVPMRWKENIQLSNWVSKQRHDFKLRQRGTSGRLTDERYRRLNELGFVWEVSKQDPREPTIHEPLPPHLPQTHDDGRRARHEPLPPPPHDGRHARQPSFGQRDSQESASSRRRSSNTSYPPVEEAPHDHDPRAHDEHAPHPHDPHRPRRHDPHHPGPYPHDPHHPSHHPHLRKDDVQKSLASHVLANPTALMQAASMNKMKLQMAGLFPGGTVGSGRRVAPGGLLTLPIPSSNGISFIPIMHSHSPRMHPPPNVPPFHSMHPAREEPPPQNGPMHGHPQEGQHPPQDGPSHGHSQRGQFPPQNPTHGHTQGRQFPTHDGPVHGQLPPQNGPMHGHHQGGQFPPHTGPPPHGAPGFHPRHPGHPMPARRPQYLNVVQRRKWPATVESAPPELPRREDPPEDPPEG